MSTQGEKIIATGLAICGATSIIGAYFMLKEWFNPNRKKDIER